MRHILLAMTSLAWTALAGAMVLPARATPVDVTPSRTVLEQVEGKEALDWVKAQNNRTAALLQADPRYQSFYRSVLSVEQASGRLPLPDQSGGKVWNFWQDAAHSKGIWRATTRASFETADPDWVNELDIDSLSKQEGRDWVFQGADCLAPDARHCLVILSLSGEDASFYREFDTVDKKFIPGGFELPHSKQRAAWLDRDTLLVSRDWGPDTMTRSGYPFSVRVVKRGEPLAAAKEIYRGTPDDMIVEPQVLHDSQGGQIAIIQRNLDFFRSEYRVYDPVTQNLHLLNLPQKMRIEAITPESLSSGLTRTGNRAVSTVRAAYWQLILSLQKCSPICFLPLTGMRPRLTSVLPPEELSLLFIAMCSRPYAFIMRLRARLSGMKPRFPCHRTFLHHCNLLTPLNHGPQ